MTSSCIELTPGFALELGRLPGSVAAAIHAFLIGSSVVEPGSERAVTLTLASDPPANPVDSRLIAERDGLSVSLSGEEIVFSAPGCQARIGTEGVELWLADRSPEVLLELVTLVLQPLLLELAWSRGRIGIHAASLSIDGLGVLLPGPSGCGKSTIFANAGRAGLDVLSDDLTWIEAAPEAWCIRPFPRGAPLAPTLSPTVEQAPLDLLVFPEIADSDRSKVLPLPRADCLLRLLRQVSMLAHDEEAGNRFRQLAALADRVSSFRLLAGRDREDVPDLLGKLMGRVDRRHPTATA